MEIKIDMEIFYAVRRLTDVLSVLKWSKETRIGNLRKKQGKHNSSPCKSQ